MSATLRIRSVRFKASPDFVMRVLHNDEPRRVFAHLHREVELFETKHGTAKTASGYALVVWGHDGSVTTTFQNYPGSPIGAAMVPDFARTCLLDLMIYRGKGD